jgi:phosphatidylserine/phosphatidylglycerophosphate/cardiolipin synthase-like enzyme
MLYTRYGVAVAWFTDRDILEELLLGKRAGVYVRIITSDKHSNRYDSKFRTKLLSRKSKINR